MRAAVMSIGSELLRGDIVDTNAPFLCRELSQIGFSVERVTAVGDDLEMLTDAFRSALAMCDVVVCSGGLGPTADDLTRPAIASALGETITIDNDLLVGVKARFVAMGRDMPARNAQQAEIIPSAIGIPNPNGTAPGWYVQRDGETIVAMPGPPREMEPMWNDWVRPHLQTLQPGAILGVGLMTYGIGESALEERVQDLIGANPAVTVATYAKSNGVQVHVSARARTPAEAQRLVDEYEAEIVSLLGTAVFGRGDDTLSAAIGRMLLERNLSLGVMESVTGGLLASLITDTPGSSTYFKGGITAYTREVKARYGVDRTIMETYGLISAETACSMAAAARSATGATIGLSTTGIAGSEPVEGKAPGTCFVAVSHGDRERSAEIRRPGERGAVKALAAQSALDLLRRELLLGGEYES